MQRSGNVNQTAWGFIRACDCGLRSLVMLVYKRTTFKALRTILLKLSSREPRMCFDCMRSFRSGLCLNWGFRNYTIFHVSGPTPHRLPRARFQPSPKKATLNFGKKNATLGSTHYVHCCAKYFFFLWFVVCLLVCFVLFFVVFVSYFVLFVSFSFSFFFFKR